MIKGLNFRSRLSRNKGLALALPMMILFLLIDICSVLAQGKQAYSSAEEQWVDSVMQTLSQRERVAQLINVAAFSNRDAAFEDSISSLISKYKIGGLIFFQGGPVRQAHLTNRYQRESAIPLLISMDAEWGLGMRLDSTLSFPYNMTLGAIQNDTLIYQLGQEIGRQLSRLGVHMNFSPVMDVNNNPNNPVINYRSFGENPQAVASKGLRMIEGLQSQGVIAVAKHFPGHGDTDTDSHYDLPQLKHSKERLQEVELHPFRKAVKGGVQGIMVAHMNIPALDSTENIPSTLSPPIVTGLLKEQMGYKGLVVTDALNMKGVTKFYSPGEVDVKALMAGNDLLMYTEDVEAALDQVELAVRRKQISPEQIDQKCRKLLHAKYRLGMHERPVIETERLVDDLNSTSAELLHRKLVEASMTLVKNQGVVPVSGLDTLSVVSLSIGADHITPFQQTLEKYVDLEHFLLPPQATAQQTTQITNQLKNHDLIIIGLHGVSSRPLNRKGYSDAVYRLLEDLAQDQETMVVAFRNAYTLNLLPMANIKAVLCTYQDNTLTQNTAAQVLFGAIAAQGQLPVGINVDYQAGTGLSTKGGLRLKYTQPEEVGIERKLLEQRIDSIVQVGLDSAAYPGAQVLVARHGKVVFHKTYGYWTYDANRPVQEDDIYDLASVTKITGPLPALMKLYGEGKINLDAPFSDYWKDFKGTDKSEMTVREVLAHYARLKPYIVYYEQARKKSGKYKRRFIRDQPSKKFTIQVAEDLYLRHNYKQKGIYKAIRKSKLEPEKQYLYSGLSFYLYPEIIENLTGQQYQQYVDQKFYGPLGAKTLTYRPLDRFSVDRIVPTEYDDFFRMKQLQGTVHDEGAAMMDGVSGNAGLFSSANDLAKLMQMYLWKGSYGGERYIEEAAVDEFTRCQYCDEGNRRGLGFDKPVIEDRANGSTAPDASPATFGHSGYTGTYTMADPETGLLMIFMSNRVYPTRNNPKLYQLNIRPAIHQVLYDAIENYGL